MNDIMEAIQEAGGRIRADERIRSNILKLEQNINAFKKENGIPDPECPLTHTFASGSYARTIFIPKDTLVVGKIHRHDHLNMLMAGRVVVATEEGPRKLDAPQVLVSKAGTKRVVYTYTDTIWTTVHLTEKTELDEIEEEIIAKDYSELDALDDSAVQQIASALESEVA